MNAAVDTVVLCGGVGAARLLEGMVEVVAPSELVAVVNVGDDLELHGLHISPDIDTIVYTLSGSVSRERGWGLEGETWQAMNVLGRYGGPDWFNLGDRDLGTHLYRTGRMRQGAPLDVVTSEIARAWGLSFLVLPVTNDRLRTMVTIQDDDGRPIEVGFQEYFVGRQHSVPVSAVRFDGAELAQPGPGVIEALASARRIVIAPSNPVVSIDPILAVPRVAELLRERRSSVVAVSPIIGGRALKGPADRLLIERGHAASVVGVAEWYHQIAATLVIDEVDRPHAAAVEAAGMQPIVTPTVMSEPGVAKALAEQLVAEPAPGRTRRHTER